VDSDWPGASLKQSRNRIGTTAKQQAEILRQALANNTKLVNELSSSLNSATADAGNKVLSHSISGRQIGSPPSE
jgi:hypothetical protein